MLLVPADPAPAIKLQIDLTQRDDSGDGWIIMKSDDAVALLSVGDVDFPPTATQGYALAYSTVPTEAYTANVMVLAGEPPEADLSNLDSEDLWEPFGGELRVEARKHIESFRRSLDQRGR